MTHFSCNSYNFKIFVFSCRIYFFVCVVSCFLSYFNYFFILYQIIFVSYYYVVFKIIRSIFHAHATQDIVSLFDSLSTNCLDPFHDLLYKLNDCIFKSAPPSCIISDDGMSFPKEAAEEFGIPDVRFWTASTCSCVTILSFHVSLKTCKNYNSLFTIKSNQNF